MAKNAREHHRQSISLTSLDRNVAFYFHFHFVAFNYYKLSRHQDVRRQGSQPSL